MANEGRELAQHILNCTNQTAFKRGDGKYYPRTSAVSRCIRDMVFHKYGEPWSDPPKAEWGNNFRFGQGHDIEDQMIAAMEAADISICFQQMEVESTSAMGTRVVGHMDGIAVIPHGLPLGGQWYVFDVKSAGAYMYSRVFDENESKPKIEHVRQVGIYSEGTIIDKNYPDYEGTKVRDLNWDDYTFGGGLIVYMSIDKPVRGFGKKRVELPKIHVTQFDIDPSEVEVCLDLYDEVEIHYRDKTVPPIPDSSDEMVWGGIRCSERWCQRYSVCQGKVEPEALELKEIIDG
jgi:hypothetical protein